jgi:hypothetical protein
MRTNIKKDSAILLLVDNMVLEDLVVQGLRFLIGSWHAG